MLNQVISITAHSINAEYRKSRTSMVDSANHIIECGRMLLEKKKELGHGNFIPWVEAECEFTRFAAAKMMKAAANVSLATHLTEEDAIAISRNTWGHNKAHVGHNSGENEWYTPSQYIEAAREVMGTIDVDPATSLVANETVQAETVYTAEDDGLRQQWHGNVWLNPPYAQPLISQFSAAVVAKRSEYDDACILVNNATDTDWLQNMLAVCDAACFVRGRVKFIDKHGEPGSPLQGQVILYIGNSSDRFAEIFAPFGWVCRKS